MAGSTSSIMGPLNLTVEVEIKTSECKEIPCLFCSENYFFPLQKDIYLAHLYLIHRLVIADVPEIAILEDYLRFWKSKFAGVKIEEYCTTILMDQLPDGTPSKGESYYLLSDVLPADYEIRQNLHAKRLETVLTRHQFERTDKNFSRGCLYCRNVITPTRADFLEHLFEKHFLQLGKPQNLVYIDDLIDAIESKMENLICLFCEKIFKDRSTLKEHMRKKGHKRINPELKTYDKYFLVNYRNDKPSHSMAKEKIVIKSKNVESSTTIFENADDDSDSDWSDWEGEKQALTCLFCPFTETNFESLKNHMLEIHTFNFDTIINPLNFYQKVKIVNYVRRQMHMLRCVMCNEQFSISGELQTHLKTFNHIGIGEQKDWDQPEFFFPTYEDDAFLCHLEDNNEMINDNNSEDSAIVFSEDHHVTVNSDAENLSMENFKIF